MQASSNTPTVVKAEIVIVDKHGTPDSSKSPIKCLYNPETLQFSRSSSWSKEEIPQESHAKHTYKGGGGASLSVRLIFDTSSTGEDVREKFTDRLFALLNVDDKLKHPPYCRFEWGGKFFFPKGFVSSVKASYTLFLPSGEPIRAEVDVSFEETDTEKDLANRPQNPTSRSEARATWVVREGERLDWIAAQEYGNAAAWRHIAMENNIEDPLALQTGQVLKLTPLS